MSCQRPQASLGAWLRGQRRERGWNVPEMTRQLRRAATATGDTLPANECLFTMIRRWERGETGVSERYMLHYCRAFEIGADQFGPPPGGDGARTEEAGTAGPGLPGEGLAGERWLAGLLKDARDDLRHDAKARQARAGQVAAGAACAAALCRGQALAFAAAADYIDAVLADQPNPDAQA